MEISSNIFNRLMMIKLISLHLTLDDQENSLLDEGSQRRDSTSGIFYAEGNENASIIFL